MHGCHASWDLRAAKHQTLKELAELPKNASLVLDDFEVPWAFMCQPWLPPSAQDDAVFACRDVLCNKAGALRLIQAARTAGGDQAAPG